MSLSGIPGGILRESLDKIFEKSQRNSSGVPGEIPQELPEKFLGIAGEIPEEFLKKKIREIS